MFNLQAKKIFQKYLKPSEGFTNIATLIALAFLLLPAAKLILTQTQTTSHIASNSVQKIASDPNPDHCDWSDSFGAHATYFCGSSTPGQIQRKNYDQLFGFQSGVSYDTLNCPMSTACTMVSDCDQGYSFNHQYLNTGVRCTEPVVSGSVCATLPSKGLCEAAVNQLCFWYGGNAADPIDPVSHSQSRCVANNGNMGIVCNGGYCYSNQSCYTSDFCSATSPNPTPKAGATTAPFKPGATAMPAIPVIFPIPQGAGYCGGDHHNPASGVTNPCPGRDSFDEAHSYPKYSYCESQYSGAFADWYTCSGTNAPGAGNSGGSGATIICDGHGNVDASYFSNGYYGPICTNITPSSDNFQAYIFDAAKAQKQTYKDYKNYDVFICTDKSYDFAPKPPKPGNSDTCGKYPWTQDASGAVPTAPAGKPACKDDTPVWDGQKCTVRPDACPNVGPHGGQNVCEVSPTNCGTPDTNSSVIPPTESDLACQLAFGKQDMKCCSKTTASPGAATATPTPTLAPGATRAPTQTPTATPAAGSATATPTSAPSGGNPTFPPASAGICPNTYYSCAPQCKPGGQSPRPEDNSACNVYHSGSVCCLQSYSVNPYPPQGSTASTGQTVTACTTNVQCVNSHQGNACVFYGASSIGVCKTVQ